MPSASARKYATYEPLMNAWKEIQFFRSLHKETLEAPHAECLAQSSSCIYHFLHQACGAEFTKFLKALPQGFPAML